MSRLVSCPSVLKSRITRLCRVHDFPGSPPRCAQLTSFPCHRPIIPVARCLNVRADIMSGKFTFQPCVTLHSVCFSRAGCATQSLQEIVPEVSRFLLDCRAMSPEYPGAKNVLKSNTRHNRNIKIDLALTRVGKPPSETTHFVSLVHLAGRRGLSS